MSSMVRNNWLAQLLTEHSNYGRRGYVVAYAVPQHLYVMNLSALEGKVQFSATEEGEGKRLTAQSEKISNRIVVIGSGR